MHPLARLLPAFGIGLVALLAWLTATLVDLKPQVDERFFFAPDSAAFREAREVRRTFASQELLVVTAQAPDIDSKAYRGRIEKLTQRLERLRPVLRVTSMTRGPDEPRDLREGPMWRRLLLAEDGSATHLVLAVDNSRNAELVASVQDVLRESEHAEFRLSLAGVPYVVEAIAQNLRADFKDFSLAAIAVFGVLMFALYRSWVVLLGSLTACAAAALATLLAQQLFGGGIGLLTANLVTISFVLTQSHIVFLTNNWRRLRAQHGDAAQALGAALRHTRAASAWCMVTALLGFVSLLFVEAQPLRELGYGGALATLSAIAAAYLVYPGFLLWAAPPKKLDSRLRGNDRNRLLGVPRAGVAAAIVGVALATGAGAVLVDSDPSLFAYFDDKSEVHRALAAVDPHGGSSPLSLAVRREDRERLDNEESYERMWELQRALQADPAVGTVLSLPVLMAEADRSPLARLLPWNWIIGALEKPRFERVAQGFISEDRRQAHYMLRMQEGAREGRRTEIIERLERTVARHGFEVTAVGGTYALQGRLADLVTRSLFEGLAGLLLAVGLIALAVTRSAPASLAMLACTATVPAVALGAFGLFGIPLDIIATPGVNVAVGVAVDSMIHLGAAWRRARGTADAAATAQREQAGGILAFSAVVIAGFAIFVFSSFPPTQRFGLAVILGTATATAMALWAFPGLLRRIGASRA